MMWQRGSALQGYNIEMGSGVYMNFGCIFLDSNDIIIGSRVLIGPNVQFYPPGELKQPTTASFETKDDLYHKIYIWEFSSPDYRLLKYATWVIKVNVDSS